jgi:methylaspartate mutase epsilon subunit
MDVAIVGMGPRGLSVLERLVHRLTTAPVEGTVRIWTFEPGEQGAGRIWRTSQPHWFAMNTVAGEVSIYSGGPDGGPPRAGAGPSLYEWLAEHPDPRWSALGLSDYAPRPVYGEYLAGAYRAIVANAPANVHVLPVSARVDRVERADGRLVVTAYDGRFELAVDKVVLTTGHPRNVPDAANRRFLAHAESSSHLRYVMGDSAAEMPLDAIAAGSEVGVIGLGLTFFDVVAALTAGRGGVFTADDDGVLRYRPSGKEPRIIAGSRSGLPMLARGRNQKAPTYRYQARFATMAALTAARQRAEAEHGSPQLDFRRDVLPLLQLEVEHTYYRTMVRRRQNQAVADQFAERHLAVAHDPVLVAKLLAEYGISDARTIDLDRMARPFAGVDFDSPQHFHRVVTDLLRLDIAEAVQGNLDGPLKAALDILRDLRGSVRAAVDFGGLRAESHRDDFLGAFNPVNTMLSAGPPAFRVEQTCALIEAGVLVVVGPALQVDCEPDGFLLSSPQVRGSGRLVPTLIDARIPRPDLHADASPLTGQLLADGLIAEHVNVDPVTGEWFATGGLAVDRAPFRVLDAAGNADPDLYALGIPTENQRWFTQIGNGRPGPLTGFHHDADAIAADVLAALRVPAYSTTG